MKEYLGRRILALVPVMFVVATLVFVLMHITPGDPVSAMLGLDASPEDIARMRNRLWLDEPLYIQYVRWLGKLARGDLGESIFLQVPVTGAVLERVEPTALLTLLALIMAVGVGIPAGVISATRFGSFVDQCFMGVALLGVSMPDFWFGLNLILLVAVKLGWLPVAGYVPLSVNWLATVRYLVMPAFCLGFIQSALIARMTRALMQFEMRCGARVVPQHSLARCDLDAANVVQPRHLLHVARMQMLRLAGRRDVGVVVEKDRYHAAEFLEDAADLTLDEIRRRSRVAYRERRDDGRVGIELYRVLQVVQSFGARMRRDSNPCLDTLSDRERCAPAFVDHDSRHRLPPAILHPMPFAGRSRREQNIRAASALNDVSNDRTLFVFENLTFWRKNRDDRRRKPRPRQIFAKPH